VTLRKKSIRILLLALVVAALGAEGETVITGVHHIDRGYAGLEDMVRRLGGTMKRREDTDEAKGA